MNKVIAERYELLENIGHGGMADVYLARDTILNRYIAIKLLRTSLANDPVYIARFQREASAAAALSHKNIVEIYDVGEDDDQYYIVMEYVPGTTLKELISKRGALHTLEAIDVMKQVLAGTARAHKMGIIHRDLKPQNILVTDSGTAKIADFGIASVASLAQVTQADVIMGSLHYLAPELVRGEKASAQSDIYALGIVFYELLRGDVPFNGDTPVNIALKHMQEEIPSIREFNSTIPQSVENIIIKATAKNLNDRYLSVYDMLEDMQTCLLRLDEEKLVFDHSGDSDPTIVAGTRSAFTPVDDEKVEPVKTPNRQVQPQKKKIDPKIIIGGVAGLVTTLVIVLFFFIFGGKDPGLMPDLVGLTEEEAIEVLKEYDVTIDNTVLNELSEKYDEGQIIKTDPKKGSSIKKGDTVTITVSKGKYIVLDNYKGMKFEDAKEELEELGFEVTMNEDVSNEKAGTVIGQSLRKGYKQDPTDEHRTITLTVSKGDYIILEDYTGLTFEQAQSKLQALNFEVIKREASSDEEAGKVIDQNLAEGYKVDPKETNRKITLTVSSGYKQIVPSVVGLSHENAYTNLKNLGFEVVNERMPVPADGDLEYRVGTVVRQSIPSGTVINKKGTQITIYYYYE